MPLNIISQTQQFVSEVRQHSRQIPVMWKKPLVFRHWLLSAHGAQIISLLLLLLVGFAIIPLIDLVLSEIFSPVTRKVLFGLITTEKENPYIETVQTIAFWSIWIFTTLLCAVLFLRHIPSTFEHAQTVVQQKIAQADQLISTQPSESILLYSAAQKWSIDEQSDTTLITKLQSINATPYKTDKTHSAAITDAPAETVILPATIHPSDNAIIAGRYKIGELLGSGAMGNVYSAEDTLLKRSVALKQLAPQLSSNESIIARFRQEALALARLSHQNIVQVYDFIEGEGFFWIVIERVTGGELEDRLQTPEAIDQQEALRLTLQMAEALAYAHEQGVIHRDFKPANVLLSSSGDVKITDFGIAKLAQSSLHTQLNTVMGTPSHMSPEQANGDDTDQRTDIYALGIILYQLLCAELPFKGDTKSVIAQHLTKKPASLSKTYKNIPVELDKIVQKMLKKNPEKRFQSMPELIKPLRKLIS